MARYIEGKHAVQEALLAKVPLVRAYVQRDFSEQKLLSELKRARVIIEKADRARLNKLSRRGAHQGIICELKPFTYSELDDLLVHLQRAKNACIVVLDHITDEGNLGAIARSAEVLGADGILIPKNRSAEVGAGTYKTSVGAVFSLPIVRVTNVASTLERLKDAGFWVIAATERAEESLDMVDLSGRACIVMGSEQKGISEGVLKHADLSVCIKQTGHIESLNVAQAASIFVYEWARQCRGKE